MKKILFAKRRLIPYIVYMPVAMKITNASKPDIMLTIMYTPY